MSDKNYNINLNANTDGVEKANEELVTLDKNAKITQKQTEKIGKAFANLGNKVSEGSDKFNKFSDAVVKVDRKVHSLLGAFVGKNIAGLALTAGKLFLIVKALRVLYFALLKVTGVFAGVASKALWYFTDLHNKLLEGHGDIIKNAKGWRKWAAITIKAFNRLIQGVFIDYQRAINVIFRAQDRLAKGPLKRAQQALNKVLDEGKAATKAYGKATDGLGNKIDRTKIKYDKLKRSVKAADLKLGRLGKKAHQVGNSLKKAGKDTSEFVAKLNNISGGMGGYVGKLQKMGDTFKKLSGPIGKAGKAAFNFFGKFPGGIIGVTLAIAAIAKLTVAIVKGVSELARMGDEIDKNSQKIGFSAQAYQQWNRVFNLAGSDMNQMANSMTRFTQNMGDAARGIGKGKDTFEALGVSIKNSDGTLKGAEGTFKETLIKLSSMRDITARNARVFELFGKSGKQLIPVLNSGAKGITELLTESEKYITVSDKQRRASVAYTDTMFDLKASFTKMKNEALEPFLIMFTQTLQMMKDSGAVKLLGEGMKGLGVVTAVALGAIIKTIHVVMAAFDTLAYISNKQINVMLKSFNWLIQKMPGVSKTFKKTIQIMTDESNEKMKGAGKDLGKNWTKAFTLGFDENTVRGKLQDIGSIVDEETDSIGASVHAIFAQINNNINFFLGRSYEGRLDLLKNAKISEENIVWDAHENGKINEEIFQSELLRIQKKYNILREEESQRFTDSMVQTVEVTASNIVRATAGEYKLTAGDISIWDSVLGVKPGQTLDSMGQTKMKTLISHGQAIANYTMSTINQISSMRTASREKEMSELQATQKAELSGLKVGAAAKANLEKRQAKESNKLAKQHAEEQRKVQIAQSLVNMSSGIAGIWSKSWEQGNVAGPILAGINTAALIGTTSLQLSNMKKQKFAEGGIVQGPTTGDRVPIQANGKEAVLTQQQQANFMEIANGKKHNVVGGSVVLNIENFGGSDTELQNFEDKLYELQSSGRFQFN